MVNYLVWSKVVIEKLVRGGFEFDLVDRAFSEIEAEIKAEYECEELSSAGALFIKAFEEYDLELKLCRERGEGRSSNELGKLYGITEAEARSGWSNGVKKKLAILSGFRGGEVDFSEKNRKILYYLPLVRVDEEIKFSKFLLKPFINDGVYSGLLSDSGFDGKGSILEVDGFESGGFFDAEVDSKIFNALENIKFGYFFLNPSYSTSFQGYVSSETFECFRVIEKSPDQSFEQKVEYTNGMFAFSGSLQGYYQSRTSSQQSPICLRASQLCYVDFLTEGLNSPNHMAAIRMYNRCWGTYSIHSHHDKALLAKVSTEILLGLKEIKDKSKITKIFCEKAINILERFTNSSRVVSHVYAKSLASGLDLEAAVKQNLDGLRDVRNKLSHDGVPDYGHINVPFYLVWFPLFWLVLFCNEKITEDEGIRFSLFCGLMCFPIADWQKIDFSGLRVKRSHLDMYVSDSRLLPKYLRGVPSEPIVSNCLESITNWLAVGCSSNE